MNSTLSRLAELDRRFFGLIASAFAIFLGVWLLSRLLSTNRRKRNKWNQICWHCLQSVKLSYNDNPYRWQCRHCHDWNVLDDNLDPVDYTPDELPIASPVSIPESKRSSSRSLATSGKDGVKLDRPFFSLCDECQDMQSRKIMLLRNFDQPQLSDISFAIAADTYAAELERKFPICTYCQGTLGRAIAASQRLVATSSFGDILHRSRSSARAGDIANGGVAWPLRRVRWFIMTGVRRFLHLAVWCHLLSLVVGGGDISVDEEFALAVFVITLPAALYFPMAIPRNYLNEVKLKRTLVGFKSYVVIRLVMTAVRALIYFRFSDELRNPSAACGFLLFDVFAVFLSRYRLSLSPVDRVLRSINKLLLPSQPHAFTGTPTVGPVVREESSADFLSSLSLNGDLQVESARARSQPLSAHPFHINNVRKRYAAPVVNAFSTPHPTSLPSLNQTPGRGFNMPVHQAEHFMKRGMNTMNYSPSASAMTYPQSPSASTGRLAFSEIPRKPNVVFRDAQFAPAIIAAPDTGLENLFDGVSLRDQLQNKEGSLWNLFGLL